MFLASSSYDPWTYLRDIKIDMGYSATSASDFFLFLQYAGGCVTLVAAVIAVIGYVAATKGSTASEFKKKFLEIAVVVFFLGGGVTILSIIMNVCNYFFGIY